ncbi:hypothetical protein AB0M28_25245 [Streptomyces sp. NPDC051940]|uniref:hypothetical protein n=1 Tax=Streptomyces sp. NPDC051940 TaxID=3155675 RepID=UPI0034492F64
MGQRRAGDGAPQGVFAAGIQVFRFYPDGVVLDVLVKPEPGREHGAQIAGWLRRESPPRGVHTARYELLDGVLTFRSPSHLRDGEVIECTGTWRGGELRLGFAGRGWKREPATYRLLWGPPGGPDADPS